MDRLAVKPASPTFVLGNHNGPLPPGFKESPTVLASDSCSSSADKHRSRGLAEAAHRRRRDRRICKRAPGEEDEEDEDSPARDDGDCSESGHERASLQYLACPFYKQNPTQYMACVRFRLKRVRDVKQHLYRCHTRHMQCPTCGTEFASTHTWEVHIRDRKCRGPPGGFPIEGVNEKQRKLLGRRSKRRDNETNQWFTIWRILFPEINRPASPYLANEFEEVISTIRDTWHNRKQEIFGAVAARDESNRGCRATQDTVLEMSGDVVEELLRQISDASQRALNPAATAAAAKPEAMAPKSSPWMPKCSPWPSPVVNPWHVGELQPLPGQPLDAGHGQISWASPWPHDLASTSDSSLVSEQGGCGSGGGEGEDAVLTRDQSTFNTATEPDSSMAFWPRPVPFSGIVGEIPQTPAPVEMQGTPVVVTEAGADSDIWTPFIEGVGGQFPDTMEKSWVPFIEGAGEQFPDPQEESWVMVQTTL